MGYICVVSIYVMSKALRLYALKKSVNLHTNLLFVSLHVHRLFRLYAYRKVNYKLCYSYFTMAVTISHPLSTPFVQCVSRQSPFERVRPHLRGTMTTVHSAESSLPISVLPDLIENREGMIFGRRTIPLRGDDRDTSSCMCGAYWNNTLQMLTCQGIVG